MRIEDYALVGDTQTAALVGRTGSIDWLCLPRFDSPACFAALLGSERHGRWRVAPRGELRHTSRRYLGHSLILETEMTCADGVVRVIDFMPMRDRAPNLIRIVEGVQGRVTVELELAIRCDYGSIVPWVRRDGARQHLVAGPDALVLATPAATCARDGILRGQVVVAPGDTVPFVLTWHASNEAPPPSPDAAAALHETRAWWHAWTARAQIEGPYRDAMLQSLIVLKALSYRPSGGIVAAPTTSLPEELGGVRNWDYRYCWLRDATFTLQGLLHAGYIEEARAWREWLVRAVAGEPSKLQILYGLTGERRIDERELGWLPGYEGSRPVRVGNAAVAQRQLDVYGELMDALYLGRCAGLDAADDAWALQCACLEWLESCWDEADDGIWEIRAGRRELTTSKVMVWVAFDRAVKMIEQLGLEGPRERWTALRDHVHAEVCTRGLDRNRGVFTQAYGSDQLDASLLLLPIVGFLPGKDPRVIATLEAIQRELLDHGLVRRYLIDSSSRTDGLSGSDGVFLACSFWLVDALVLAGRRGEAVGLFERLLALRNDVGLLSEQYDPLHRRLVGNFPQAFSHVALINSARNLTDERGPASQRAGLPREA